MGVLAQNQIFLGPLDILGADGLLAIRNQGLRKLGREGIDQPGLSSG